jgi:hypothetical protein
MPLLKTEADKLSNNQLVAGVVEQIIDRDDLFAVLPFVGVNGKAYVYERENGLPTADFLDPNDTVNEGAATFTEVVAKLRILIGDVDVDKFIQTTLSDTNDQTTVQIAQKAKGLGRVFHQTLATGDTGVNTKAFDGLAVLAAACPSTQQVSAGTNGGALTLTMLDQLLDSVPNGADVIVMRRGTIRAFRGLLRATSGTDAVMQMMDNFGRPMLTHNGVPIIMNEFLSGVEDQGTATGVTCSVYALRLNETDGLHGLYASNGAAGVVVENIGTVQNKDANRIRLKWYVGLALKSTRSMARLKGITNI